MVAWGACLEQEGSERENVEVKTPILALASTRLLCGSSPIASLSPQESGSRRGHLNPRVSSFSRHSHRKLAEGTLNVFVLGSHEAMHEWSN